MTTGSARWQRWLPWTLAVLGVLWLLAWFAVPPLVKAQIEKQGSALLGRELRLGGLELSPRKLALTLSKLSLAAAPGSGSTQPQLQVERLYVDLDMRSILRLAPVVEALEIDAPQVRLTRLADGHYDIGDLIQRFSTPQAAPKNDEPARFALFNLQLRNGEFIFDDRPVQRVHKVSAFTLTLPFLSNLPADVQIKVEPRLAFVVDGSAFDIGGQSTPFADGRASEFKLRIAKLQLQPWWAYLPRQLPVRAEGGVVDSDLALRFEQRAQGDNHVVLHGGLQLANLLLRDADGGPLLEWGQLALKLTEVLPLERQAALESVQADGLRLHVRRDASGVLNFQRVAAAAAPAASASAQSAAQPAEAPSQATAASVANAVSAANTAKTSHDKAFKVSLQHLELNDARIEFADAVPQPAVQMALEAMNVTLHEVRWPAESDAQVKLQARLWAAGQDVGQLQAQGTASDQHANIAFALKGLQLSAAEPYLREVLRPRASATVDADVQVDWAVGSEPRLALALSKLRVVDFDLSDRPAPGGPAVAVKARKAASGKKARSAGKPSSLVRVPLLEVTDLNADLLKRQVVVGSVLVQRPFVELARDAQGALSADAWRADTAAPSSPATTPGRASAPAGAAGSAPEWRAELRDFKLDAGQLRFSDAALGREALDVDKLRLSLQGLAWPLAPGAKPLRTELSASLRQRAADGPRGGTPAGAAASRASGAAASTLDWRGQVALSPASLKGQLRVERFPVHVFEPYFASALPVLLASAEAGFRGTLDLRQAPQGWAGKLRGDALLADVRVNARGVAQATDSIVGTPDGSELLSWDALALTALSVELRAAARPRVEIGELRLSDYFSRLEISEQGRLNLQNVVAAAPGAGDPNPPPASASSPPPAPSAPASAADVSFGSRLRNMPVELVVGSVQLNNGRVEFSDRFIRPNYRAQLSELNGRIGRFDSTAIEATTVQFGGRVFGTGLLDIGGAINPMSNPPALDVAAKATDIELPGLTPYSAKYAGYPIERGKLSVDVAYKIDAQGNLDARNQIVVNQLTFGPKSDSPDATTLPVRLAVALLQDANGVIDIDLPVTGSINEPQFSLFALILKVIGNLFTKIVTAPFSVLAGGGDGKDLNTIVFQPGSAVLAAGDQATVDKVAKALANRPALNLTVAGQANAQTEAAAMQRAALEQRIRDEQRRERARGSLGSSAAADAPLPALTAEQRTQIVKALYTNAELPDKPRNAIGLLQELPLADMEARLAAAVPVDEAAARALAVQRARAVREAFIDKGLGSERLFLAEPNAKSVSADNAPLQPQALLTVAPK